MSTSALMVGTVRHRRRRPTRNAFRYPVHHLLLDLDDLSALDRDVVGFGHNRPAPVAFHDVDHLGPLDAPVRTKLAALLAIHGHALPDGPVRVLASPRVLGHVFNPVSWWFCHHPDGTLALVVAEVRNTFGQSYPYVLDDLVDRGDGVLCTRAAKRFHVSPFLDVDGHEYAFAFRLTPDRILVHLDVADAGGVVLDATQDERRQPLTTGTLWRALLRQPHVPLHTLWRIHRQALRLWRRRVPFHRTPAPPPDGYPRSHADLRRARRLDPVPSPASGPGRAHPDPAHPHRAHPHEEAS